MANTSSAKKAARQMIKRTEINKSRRSELKGYVRKVEEALASGDKTAAASRPGRRRADSHAHGPEGRDSQEIRLAQGVQTGCAGPGAGLNGGYFSRSGTAGK